MRCLEILRAGAIELIIGDADNSSSNIRLFSYHAIRPCLVKRPWALGVSRALRNAFSTRCTREGQTGPDDSAQTWTRKTKKSLQPSSTGSPVSPSPWLLSLGYSTVRQYHETQYRHSSSLCLSGNQVSGSRSCVRGKVCRSSTVQQVAALCSVPGERAVRWTEASCFSRRPDILHYLWLQHST